MKRILKGLTALAVIVGVVGCGKVTEKTPVYKFSAKVNGASWATDMVEPSTTPSEASYVSDLYYYTGSKSISVTVKNPKNNNRISFSLYIPSVSNAVGTYSYSNSNFYPYFYVANLDSPTINSRSGQFEITKFSYDLNTGKITSFSGKFSYTITAEHSDGVVRTTSVTDGEINNLTN